MSNRTTAQRQTWAVDSREITDIGMEIITGADICPACQLSMPWVGGKIHATRCAGLREMAKAIGRERRANLRKIFGRG